MADVRQDLLGRTVPVGEVRRWVEEAGLSHRELAGLLDWTDSRGAPDLSRVRRMLGLEVNFQSGGRYPPKVARVVYNKTARRLYAAIERAREHPPERPEPPDVSSVPTTHTAFRCRRCGRWSHAEKRPAWHRRIEPLDGDDGRRADHMVRCGPFDTFAATVVEFNAQHVFATPIPGTEREHFEDPNEGIGWV